MIKKNLKHVVAIVLLVGFAVLALGSMGSSPSSGGSSESSGCSSGFNCFFNQNGNRVNACSSSSCDVNKMPSGWTGDPRTCTCKKY